MSSTLASLATSTITNGNRSRPRSSIRVTASRAVPSWTPPVCCKKMVGCPGRAAGDLFSAVSIFPTCSRKTCREVSLEMVSAMVIAKSAHGAPSDSSIKQTTLPPWSCSSTRCTIPGAGRRSEHSALTGQRWDNRWSVFREMRNTVLPTIARIVMRPPFIPARLAPIPSPGCRTASCLGISHRPSRRIEAVGSCS